MSTESTPATGFKPKKSVALSGVAAGNTALCTVGRSGNDLHYRGYDILDLAENCEFEEVAHLLIHGRLPSAAELRGYKQKLRRMRGLPATVLDALETLPAASHPMDVMRTGVSVLGCALPEKDDHNIAGARDMILMLVEEHLSRHILEQVAADCGFDTKPGTGVAFQIDIEDAIGLRSQIATIGREIGEEEL